MKMNNDLVQVKSAGNFIFPKTLTHTQVAAIPISFWENAAQVKNWKIDLTKVEVIDSSFFALLLYLLRFTRSKQISLKLEGLNHSISALLKVYGVFNLFTGVLK